MKNSIKRSEVPMGRIPDKPDSNKDDPRSELFEVQSRFLLGKILTIMDAAIADLTQRKALKDLIKQQFYEQQKHVHNICHEGSRLIEAAGEFYSPFRAEPIETQKELGIF